MTTIKGERFNTAPSPVQTKKSTRKLNQQVKPDFPALQDLPRTPIDLFRALALTVTPAVHQPVGNGNKPLTKQQFALPWAGFESWRDARLRLEHFEKTFEGKIAWAPFNDSNSNDGPMTLSAYPGRAFIERVTNEGDANLEAKALTHEGPMPASPREAAELWFGLGSHALSSGLKDDDARALAQETVTVTGFVGDGKDPKNSIFDSRDYGIGLTADEMPSTILSLNRGNKKSKQWLTGKHGQGASSTYQYSDLTLIASRKVEAKKVAFTLVEASWDSDDGIPAKTPTYRYLTLDGKVPEINVPEEEFSAGTLVRHIGYNAADLFHTVGENSLYGLLMRSLAEPLFPVWFEMFALTETRYSAFPGFRRYGRLIRGSVNALERAWMASLKSSDASMEEVASAEDDEAVDLLEDSSKSSGERAKILHRASEYYEMPRWDYGGRTGVGDLGRVKITYWVAEPAGRSSHDVLRSWGDPDKTILMTLDGQTHAEESRAIITGQHGAKLWAVGRYMVVQIDCNDLDPRAKYELFTSTREHAKETPVKKMILDELIARLGFDRKLQDLNVQLAAADIKQTEDAADTISTLIKKYLKAAGISFDQLTRKVEKWKDVEEDREIATTKPEPPPIEAVEPPTFVRWKFKGTSVKLYPGQRYSFVFETDAAPSYWNPADQTISKIRVLAHGVRYVGAGEMKGGRVRCHFICPEDSSIGTKGYIQVQLDFTIGAALTHRLPVEIVPKPSRKQKEPDEPKPPKPKDYDGDENGSSKKVIKVKIRKKDFTEVEIPVVMPIPVKSGDNAWLTLAWPHDPQRVGFSIRSLAGKIQLYYNAEFPPFLDMKRKMSKKSLEEEFVRRYTMKLVLHAIFTLNYDFVDEDEFGEEQRKKVRDLLCATAESLALATKSELEIESRLKSEDSVPLETTVAATQQTSGVETVS